MVKKIAAGVVALAFATNALAAEMPPDDMLPGVTDHPLLSRYAGSKMSGYLLKKYDETDLIAGKLVKGAGAVLATNLLAPGVGMASVVESHRSMIRSLSLTLKNS